MKKQSLKKTAGEFLSMSNLLKDIILKTKDGKVTGDLLKFATYNKRKLADLDKVETDCRSRLEKLSETSNKVNQERLKSLQAFLKKNNFTELKFNQEGLLIQGERYPVNVIEFSNKLEDTLDNKYKEYFEEVRLINKDYTSYYKDSELDLELLLIEESDLDNLMISGIDNMDLFSEFVSLDE